MKTTSSHQNQPTIESLQAQVEELTAKENDLSPYHYLRYLFETLPNMDLTNKKEIDKVLPWSSSLPSACRVPIKSEANKT
ncbi:transposase domain-containing protein [Peribacillus sp. N3]|uniref:transposase domain-containing protein n=1 Tax=Peribacillus castrilensis TaxID=2897690 RepID=UPI00296EA886|nr:transposase domain-containing protein [Peribacillus castrilensis]